MTVGAKTVIMLDDLRTTLGELVDSGEGFIQTGPFGSQLHAHNYVEIGIPVVMPQQLGDNKIRIDGISRVGERDRDRLVRHVMRTGDIVFSRRGDVTRRAYITDKEDGWLCGTGCLLLRLEHPECDNRYLVRFLGLHETRSYLTRRAIGATMPNLNQGILASIPVVLPPRKRQERIVDVASTYDNLIENNRRRIQLLEQAARLLYEEWFVRFRFPEHERVDVRDGVPEGWRRVRLSEVVDTQYGFTQSATDEPVGPKFLRGKDINKASYIDWDTVPYCSEQNLDFDKYALSVDDILVVRMADPGKVAIVEAEQEAVFASYLVRLSIRNGMSISPLYLFFVLSDDAYQGFVSRASGGSTRKSASAKLLVDFRVLVPSSRVMAGFVALVTPLRRQIQKLLRQNASLKRVGDLLLPRLMNGEVTV